MQQCVASFTVTQSDRFYIFDVTGVVITALLFTVTKMHQSRNDGDCIQQKQLQ